MSKSDQSRLDTLDDILEGIEGLRSQVVDLEAMAHAAAQTLEHLPYVPREDQPAQQPAESAGLGPESRLHLNRLQALVAATAEAAFSVLSSVETLLAKAKHTPARPGGGNGSSHAGEHRAVYRVTAPDLRLVG